ncbi:MAG: tetratricopeptide repeat protein [Methylococcaceae bacterium]|nr:tetratricopeptide repeat protein [Methylococcaceae bacterium]
MFSTSEKVKSMMNGRVAKALLNYRNGLVDIAVLTTILLFLIDYFDPKYLLSETITTGGDTASHYYTAQYLRDHLLPNGKITGWTQGNYAGFPILQFYFPLPFLTMVGLSYLMPLQIAFKIASVMGVFALPLACYGCLRLMRLPFPAPIFGAVFSLPFLFMEGNSMWGANINSTLAGEIAYSWGFSLTILLFGVLYRDVPERKHVARNAVLVFLIGFSHGYTLLFAGLVSSFFLWTSRDFLKKFWYLFKIYLLAFLLLGFWIIPLLSNLPYTTAYNFLWVFNSISELFPQVLYPVLALAGIGVGLEIYRMYKSKSADMAFWFVCYWMLLSALCFLSAFKLGVVDIRFLPFLQIAVCILAAQGLYRLAAKARNPSLLAGLVALATLLWTDDNTQSIASWIAWNYSGFEQKSLWPQFSEVNKVLKGSPSDPRVVFEHSSIHNNAGTTRAFESLPLFAGRSTLEGLYMQASPTAPFVFDIQSEISEESSCPFPAYSCSRHNIDQAVKHLEMFNIADFVVVSDLVKSELQNHPKFKLKSSSPPYDVYQLTTNENRYVVPLEYEPVFVNTKDWKSVSYQWFKDFANNDVHLVFAPGTEPADRARFKTAVDGDSLGRLPRLATGAKGEIKETVLDDEIIIDTEMIGRPLLVKVSYHPNWKVEGADKIFLASPSFMLIYPKQPHVRLYYGESAAESIGRGLSLMGLTAMLLGLSPVRRRIPFALEGSITMDGLVDKLNTTLRANRHVAAKLDFCGNHRTVVVAASAFLFFSALFAVVLLNKGQDAQSLLRDGILLKDLGQYSEARDNFKKILDKYPLSGVADQAGYYFAITHYMEGHCEPTIAGFEDLIKRYPESVWVPEAYYHIGLCDIRLEKLVEASKTFSYVIREFPASPWAGRSTEALDGKSPSDDGVGARELYGEAIASFNDDRCDDVKKLAKRLQDESPDFAKLDETIAVQALCLFKEKNYGEAIQTFDGMLKRYPESDLAAEAYYHIGLSNQYLSRRDEARKALHAVVDQYPKSEWAGRSLEALNSELK